VVLLKNKETEAFDRDTDRVYKSYHQSEKIHEKPLIRVMALHALAYCERLFYLEEVEEIRVADSNVYAGRALHEDMDKGADVFSLELASESLGIRGKMDCVRRESGHLIVFEHKKGRSKDGNDVWPSDRLQVLAYTLLLAEHTGEMPLEARIKYHADKKTITIPFCYESALKELNAAIDNANKIRDSLDRPSVTVSEKLCRTCSLAPVCLPEEERFAADEEQLPKRLFPPDDDRKIVHLVEQGCSIHRSGEQIVVSFPDGRKKTLPGMSLSALVLHGNIQISTQTLHFCAANNIGIHWLSYGGFYVGGLNAGAGAVQRRNRQFAAFQEPALKAALCGKLVSAKVENQLKYLLRLTRGDKSARDDDFESGLAKFRCSMKELDKLCSSALELSNDDADAALAIVASMRGVEGASTRDYFSLLPTVLKIPQDHLLAFSGRNRRPPRDPFNALLSFGYALLYRDCVSASLAVGLDPSFGFMHTSRSTAYPLALDLMDLFRLILWDMPLIGSINRNQWGKTDFEITGKQVWLNVEGRRKAIGLYESRKSEKWKHPVLDYSLSYARTIELEARLLEKEWCGSPGLFARLRLR